MPNIKIKTEDGKTLTIIAKDGINGENGKDGVNGKNGINGKDGAKGDTGGDGKNGVNGKNGLDGINGKDGVTPTINTVIKEVIKLIPREKKITYKEIVDAPDIEVVKQEVSRFVQNSIASRDYDITEIKGVSIVNPTNDQVFKYNSTTGKWENGTASGGGTWGSITGTLSNQTDLQTALNLKANLTTPTFTTNITTPLVIGGATTTSTLTFKTTTGVGTTGADMIFVGGNNGATEFARILNSGNFGVGTASPSYLFDAKKTGGTGTIIGSFGDLSNNSRISFKPYDVSIEGFVQGSFGTTLQFNAGGFAVIDSGNTGNTLFKYDTVGLHAKTITSASIVGAVYNQLRFTSNWYPSDDTTNPAINFTTYNSAGSSDVLAKLQIYNGDAGKILLNPTGGNVGIGLTVPTAVLHLKAGTATANTAPIKFTSGTLNTVAVVGQYEYNGVHYITSGIAKRQALGGKVKEFYTSVGNSTTTETDLYTYTTEASLLTNNGDELDGSIGGIFVSSGTATRQVKLYFGGTVIFDSGALSISTSASWVLNYSIIRVSATVVRYRVALSTQGAALAAYTSVGELTGLTLSNTNVFKITGQAGGVGAATDDIVAMNGDLFLWGVSV